jgi:hypothetical protein
MYASVRKGSRQSSYIFALTLTGFTFRCNVRQGAHRLRGTQNRAPLTMQDNVIDNLGATSPEVRNHR